MVNAIEKIINTSYEEVIASSLVLDLLNTYSKLFINGAQPGTCGSCLREYYLKIKKEGMELAKKYEEIKNRTCSPAWKGLKYIPATARHWNNELLTDNEAIRLLENGHLKEVDFEILPKSYGPIPEEKVIEDFQKRHAPRVKKVKKNN